MVWTRGGYTSTMLLLPQWPRVTLRTLSISPFPWNTIRCCLHVLRIFTLVVSTLNEVPALVVRHGFNETQRGNTQSCISSTRGPYGARNTLLKAPVIRKCLLEPKLLMDDSIRGTVDYWHHIYIMIQCIQAKSKSTYIQYKLFHSSFTIVTHLNVNSVIIQLKSSPYLCKIHHLCIHTDWIQ